MGDRPGGSTQRASETSTRAAADVHRGPPKVRSTTHSPVLGFDRLLPLHPSEWLISLGAVQGQPTPSSRHAVQPDNLPLCSGDVTFDATGRGGESFPITAPYAPARPLTREDPWLFVW